MDTAMPSHEQLPPEPRPSLWQEPPRREQGRGPLGGLSQEQLARAALLEQMAHGSTYGGGHQTGGSVHDDPDVDRRQMLIQNGYNAEPQLISGRDGMQMVIYTPAEGSDAQPVVSFRGTEELADLRSDVDPQGIGSDQYAANQRLIDRTMREIAEQYGPAEITGHSLGGALAQTAAAHNPAAAGHITTFQAPGVDDDDVARIEAYNRQRTAQGLPPLQSTHFRAGGDLVPLGGEAFSPGQVHEMELRSTVELPIVGDVARPIDPLTAHTSHPVTAAAMQTAAGRAALPGIDAPHETVTGVRSYDAAEDNESIRFGELIRRGVGYGVEGWEQTGRAAREVGDAALGAGNRAVDAGQAVVGDAAGALGRGVDAVQAGGGALASAGSAAIDHVQGRIGAALGAGGRIVDSGQGAIGRALGAGNAAIDRTQAALGSCLPPAADWFIDAGQSAVSGAVDLGQRGIDLGQRAVGGAVAAGQRAVDFGQQLAGGVSSAAGRAVDAGQSLAGRALAGGQGLIDGGQRAMSSLWSWIAD
jgi:hypothetical protein